MRFIVRSSDDLGEKEVEWRVVKECGRICLQARCASSPRWDYIFSVYENVGMGNLHPCLSLDLGLQLDPVKGSIIMGPARP